MLNTMDTKVYIRSMSFYQQVALWIILRMPRSEEEDFKFTSSEFMKVFIKFLQTKLATNPDEAGKFAGAILSSLVRNSLLEKINGDRDKGWTLSETVKQNYSDIKQHLFEVKTYWG